MHGEKKPANTDRGHITLATVFQFVQPFVFVSQNLG